MVKALARAFRWQRMLDDGVCGTIKELAKREPVNRGYMSRVLWLTLLAPDIEEAILDRRQPEGCGWRICLRGFRWSGTCNGWLDFSWRIPPVLTGAQSPFHLSRALSTDP